MPASVSFYPGQGVAFSVAATIGLPVWEPPFPELTDRLVFRQRHMVLAASYSPLAPNITYGAHGSYGVPTSSSYYLVEEGGFSDERGGLLTFDRLWAAVPSTRYEYTSIAFPYPGMVARPAVTGSYTNILSFGYGGVDRMYISTDGSVTFSIGDYAAVSFRSVVSGTTINNVPLALVRDVGTTGGAIVDLVPNLFDASVTVRQVARAIPTSGRQESEVLVGRAVLQFTYALITASVTPVFTFSGRQTFLNAGAAVDYVDSQTVPSLSTYAGWVAAGTFFNAADDEWARWLGNIYEKKTTLIVAL